MSDETVNEETSSASDRQDLRDGSSSQEIKAEGGSTISKVMQVAGDYHEHHHYPAAQGFAEAPVYLPPKAYHQLIGRFDELDRVLSALRDPQRKPIVAVVGLGGIGKTTLAREAVERSWQEKLFDYTVWASAKTERFVGEGIARTGISSYTFDDLLSEIGRQCDRMDIATMPSEQKEAAITHLLANKRVLIAMDNLETVVESERLVDNLFQILGKEQAAHHQSPPREARACIHD